MPQSKRHPARRPQQRAARTTHRPRPAASQPAPPASTGWRRSLEVRSAGPLALVYRMPRALLMIVMIALLVGGLALPWAWTGILLVILGLFLGWLAVLSWPRVSAGGRFGRSAVALLLLGLGIAKLLGLVLLSA